MGEWEGHCDYKRLLEEPLRLVLVPSLPVTRRDTHYASYHHPVDAIQYPILSIPPWLVPVDG